jgi:hypothetical protein
MSAGQLAHRIARNNCGELAVPFSGNDETKHLEQMRGSHGTLFKSRNLENKRVRALSGGLPFHPNGGTRYGKQEHCPLL